MRGSWVVLLFCATFASSAYAWHFPTHDYCAADTDLNYFLDSENKSTPSDVLSLLRNSPLKKSPQNLHYGYTKGTVWLYLKVKTNHDLMKCTLEFANPQLDKITVYHVINDVPSQVAEMGDSFTFEHRFYRTRNYVFPFRSENQEFVISLHSNATMTVPIKIISRDKLVNEISLDYLLLGFFYGIMVFFIFFGFHSYISFKDRAYFLYGLFALSMLLFFMDRDGITYQLFWPNATYWKLRSARVFAALGMALGVFYYVHILQVDKRWLRNTSYAYIALCLLLGVSLLILPP